MDRNKAEKIIDVCMLETFISASKAAGLTFDDGLFDFFRLLIKNGCPLEALMNSLYEFSAEDKGNG